MKKIKKGYKLIECPGAAHSNPFIDNCMLCAPRWGQIEILEGCKDLNEHRDEMAKRREQAYEDAMNH